MAEANLPTRKAEANLPTRKAEANLSTRKPEADLPIRKAEADLPIRKAEAEQPIRKAEADLPIRFSREHQVLVQGGALMCGPGASLVGLREGRRRAGAALTVTRVSAEAFEALLQARFQARPDTGLDPGEALTFEIEADPRGGSAPRDLMEDTADAPVVELVNQLLRRTVRAGASDLHIEPYDGGLRARLRIDGTLQTVLDRTDLPAQRVVSRLKVMAALDIAETRLPQDGRIALRLGARAIDVRVSTLPGQFGERVVMRMLDRSSGLMPLDQLGLAPDQVATLARLAALPNGIILSTGPTGSGKTTTLYSLLQVSNRAETNIVTVEDPIEYNLPGVSQSQINTEIGMTFAAGLRATLRQDPDVILVGEIRDGETARTAAQAALTGHLVFSSLHANGAIETVVRLRDLGLEDFLIASTLRGIVAQRLLRVFCPDCRRQGDAPDAPTRALFEAAGLAAPAHLHEAAGCASCGETGFAGRVGVFELVEVGEALSDAISAGASEAHLRGLAQTSARSGAPTGAQSGARAGAGSLQARALALVAAGRTSLAEVRRVIGAVP